MSFEKEVAQAKAALDLAAAAQTNASADKQAAQLVQAMQITQRNIMQTFAEFQTSFRKMAEDMAVGIVK